MEDFLQRFKAGTVIFKQGDPGCVMFFIQAGQVAISCHAGAEERRLAILEKGDFFGEMAMLEEYPERSATASAVTDVEALQLRGSDFNDLLRRKPEIAVRMMSKLSERLRESNRRLEELMGEQADIAALAPKSASQGLDTWAVLFHEGSHRLFPLRPDGETTLGRHDVVTGVTPDIDLTELDPERTVSRRHASITCRDGGVTVVETNASTNGTFVNGAKLEAFKPCAAKDGDLVQFAMVTVRLSVLTKEE